MKKILPILISIIILFPLSSNAAELLMIHNPSCVYCQKFMKETKPTYHESTAATVLPLTIINIREIPNWFRKLHDKGRIDIVHATPTFIIFDGNRETGKEIGRIMGYPGKDRFYNRLNQLIKNLDLK